MLTAHDGTRTEPRSPISPRASARSSGCASCSKRPSLADELGLDVFAIGEHHRPDFLVSSPAVVLAAVAVKTERIRLSSAVTVLSSDDPVRVFQDFAHVDLLSGGRAEIMAGTRVVHRVLPAVRLRPRRLRRAVRREARAAARRSGRPNAGELVGPSPGAARATPASGRVRSRTRCRCGSPSAARRSRSSAPACSGLPLTIAIIGGQPERFVAARGAVPRGAAARPGHDPARGQIAINTHAFVARDLGAGGSGVRARRIWR